MQISQPLKKSVLYGVLGQDMESIKVVNLNYRINWITISLFSNSAFLRIDVKLLKSFSFTTAWKTLVANCREMPK